MILTERQQSLLNSIEEMGFIPQWFGQSDELQPLLDAGIIEPSSQTRGVGAAAWDESIYIRKRNPDYYIVIEIDGNESERQFVGRNLAKARASLQTVAQNFLNARYHIMQNINNPDKVIAYANDSEIVMTLTIGGK